MSPRKESKVAWRRPKDKPKALEHFASEMLIPDGARDFDSMTVKWGDGTITELPWLTVAQYRSETGVKCTKGSKGGKSEPATKPETKPTTEHQPETQAAARQGVVVGNRLKAPSKDEFEWFTGKNKSGEAIVVEPKRNNPKGKRTQLLVRVLVAKVQLVQM